MTPLDRPRRRTLTFVITAVLVLVAAFVVVSRTADDDTDTRVDGADQEPAAVDAPGTTGEPSSISTGSTTATTGASSTTVAAEPITLAFAGDTNFEDVSGSPADRIRPFQDVLSSADLAVLNLETAITEGGSPVGKQFTFRAPAAVLDGLAANGIDAVSMANNHGMDFGSEGLIDSLVAKQTSPIPVLGIGADEDEAFAPFTTTVKGSTVSIIAATQVLDDSLVTAWTATDTQGGLASAKRVDRLVEEVTAARSTADVVVVFLHWGIERTTCPSGDQQDLARTLVDAGADIVVGGHAHRVLGGGRLDDAVVHYGLGNFGFYSASGAAATTGVFTVTVAGGTLDYQWHPGVIRGRVPYPLTGGEQEAAATAWDGLRACTGLAP